MSHYHTDARGGANDARFPTPLPRRRAGRTSGIVWCAIAVLVLGCGPWPGVGETARAAAPDAFYDAPGSVPPYPGALLRSEPFTRGIPRGARAWRILYTTTRDDATPAVASGIVLAPDRPITGVRPIITWAHGSTGTARQCAPSLLDNPFSAGAAPAIDQVIAEGWVLVATDYVGLGTGGPHPYLIGQPEARSALDATRAARQLSDLTLDNGTVIWGHSQGGQAALWAGILSARYAPDLNVLGVAALAPASDLMGTLASIGTSPLGPALTAYVASAWSDVYPDIHYDDIVRPEIRDAARAMADICLTDLVPLAQLTRQIGGSVFAVDPTTYPPLAAQLAANAPNAPIVAPLLIAQGAADDIVDLGVQGRFVAARCAAGQRLDYRIYAGQDHGGIVAAGSPSVADLIHWTEDRLAEIPQDAGCRTVME